jgi:CheY-like chemotaxis protein
LLQAVLGQTSLVFKTLETDHPLRDNVRKAAEAAERAAHLTQQLLAYSGRSKFEIRVINLNTFLTDNLHLLRVSIAKQIRLDSHFDEFLPAIEGDPGQMQQIIMNLIINASEAIGDQHGVISISTSTQIIQENDKHWWKRTGEPLAPGIYVILEVSDTGCGMTPETLEKIFDPFFTTKFTGRGLGLAAVLGIVRGHKGALKVESSAGKGTTFRVALPASFQRPDESRKIEMSLPDIALTGTILLIDDEDFVREAAKDILELHGLKTMSASDGEKGVALYRANKKTIDLVILDLSMPGIGGEETFRRLKHENPDVQVVLTSGYTESDAMAKLAGQRLAGFIQKPYRSEDLMKTMHRHLQPRTAG